MQLFLRTSLITLAVFALVGCKNFHTVEKDKLYRSAQLKGDEFQMAIDQYKIKTIINLRGAYPDQQWYLDEMAVSEKNGIAHFDLAMGSNRLPRRDDLIKLLDIYKTAERPMLVHCRMGADRTGEAAALYKNLYMNSPIKEAIKMLAMKYFHFSFIMPAKKYFVGTIWQGEDWARTKYDPCAADQNYKYYDKSQFCGQVPLNQLAALDDKDSSTEDGDPDYSNQGHGNLEQINVNVPQEEVEDQSFDENDEAVLR
jgi:protein tyrosine phosphatase (PTP) superfamily phosphohydrolase (DUF442 family)